MEVGADVRSYTFEGLTNGKTYTIYIMAVNDIGESEKLTLQGKPSGGIGSAGIGSSSQKQPISASKTANGEVALSVTSAKWGDIITITVLPDEGYKLDTLEILDKRGNTVAYEAAEEEGKYTFAMPSTEVTVTPTFVKDTDPAGTTPPEDPDSVTQRFSDVRPDAWYRDIIQYVFDKGIMTGVASDTFSPETACTRGTVITMLYRLEGEPEVVEGGSFFDVPEDAWYAKGTAWAATNGIVNGFEDASFRPESPVTREQLVAILYRYAAKKGYDVTDRAELSGFTDAEDISAWAVDAMKWAVSIGLIKGVGDDQLAPERNATRAEIAAMLMRYCENVAK